MERAGLRALLFIDIEGSTALQQRLGPAYAALLTQYDALVRAAVAHHDGDVDGADGDGYFLVFDAVAGALAAAVEMQLSFATTEWPEDAGVRVRMGLHAGEVLRIPSGLVGLAIHYAARIMSAGHGGQLLVSDAAKALVDRLPEQTTLRPLGVQRVRDMGDTPLFQVVHPELPDTFPPLRLLAGRRDNLPVPSTSLIGRDDETDAVMRLLDAHRIVTLTGAGGCGKTRLAIRVAAEADRFVDGVRIAELAAVADPAEVPAVVAAAIGSSVDDLVATLCERNLLLVLDNCEHLLDASADLAATLLRSCPDVTVLAASREPLGVTGEAVYRVPSLSIPDAGASLAELRSSDAARLFEARVALVRPGFEIGADDADAVGDICRRLDGVPLAIELAAARCRLFSPAELAARLDDRFRLLTGGARDALPRQQTLLATVDWSYRLLGEAERLLLARLAVFHGGADLEAIEQVCSDASIAALDVADLVLALVDKSLLALDPSVPGTTRVRLPETIRQFAAERLIEHPDLRELRDRHASWFASFDRRLGLGPWERSLTDRTDRARADQENLAAALEWSTALGSVDALRVIMVFTALHPELREPDRFGERVRAALDALPDAPDGLRAMAFARLAWALVERDPDDVAAALATVRHGCELARRSGDSRIVSDVLTWTGFMCNDPSETAACARESLAAADATGDPEFAVRARQLVLSFCDMQSAPAIVDEALALVRAHDLNEYRSAVAQSQADVACHFGDHDTAHAAMSDALRFDASASLSDRWATRTWGGVTLTDEGDLDEAEALLADALALTARTPLERETHGALAHLARVRGDHTRARAEAELALDAQHHFLRWTDGLALLALAAAQRHDGDARAATRTLLPLLEPDVSRRADLPAQAMEEFAACLDALGDTDGAARVLATADHRRAAASAPVPPGRQPLVDALRSRLPAAAPLDPSEVLARAETV